LLTQEKSRGGLKEFTVGKGIWSKLGKKIREGPPDVKGYQ